MGWLSRLFIRFRNREDVGLYHERDKFGTKPANAEAYDQAKAVKAKLAADARERRARKVHASARSRTAPAKPLEFRKASER